MDTEPFQLNKRFRYREEDDSMRTKTSWTKAIINLENGTVLTRRPFHWLLLLIFYAIFFCGIIFLWALCYWAFGYTITKEKPKWLLTQPGLSFEPATTFRENYLKIEYHEQSHEEVQAYVDHINKALGKYGQIPKYYFIECQSRNYYGYRERKPCFFLKINRVIGFKTLPIDSLGYLPYDAPKDLYFYIKSLEGKKLKERIWVSCESKPELKFVYYPQRFYNVSAVDYASATPHGDAKNVNDFYNESDFQRVIAVQIQDISLDIKHHIRCFLWARNIVRDLKGKIGKGLVRFSFEIKS